jgi:pimeloyl-ACP methyl ester carboxylesterase
VRAAHHLTAAHAGADFAIWGHSQGGQAALFTAQLATGYAPELHLVGVAAGGPVPSLVDLFQVNVKTLVGKILIAMAVQSWAKVYHDARLDQVITPAARPLVAKIAGNCLYGTGQLLGSLPSGLLLGFTFVSTPPWTVQPWQTILEQNNPGGTPIAVPVLMVQGDADTIVAPQTTERLAAKLCAGHETVDLRLYPGIGHLDTGQHAAPDVAQWIAARFTGQPPPKTCP